MSASGTTAVVHLVRRSNGEAPLRAFLDSYRAHDAGAEHELVLLFKGFAPGETEPLRALVGVPSLALHVPDDGLDLTAYRAVAAQLDHERVCFLNSFSEIQTSGWLRLLSSALDERGAAAAGASGSWASLRSFRLFLLGLPSAYREVLGDRAAVAAAFADAQSGPRRGAAARMATALGELPQALVGYRPFPAPHLRTNAFLVERARFAGLRARGLATKAGSHRFESGRRGMSAQLRAASGRLLVVGADGEARDVDDWPAGDVFWQGDQRELLVADNQTRLYARAAPDVRTVLSRQAWGRAARVG